MTIEDEYIKERIRMIDDTVRTLKKAHEDCYDCINTLLIQKYALKKKDFYTKSNFIEIVKKNQEYKNELLNVTKNEISSNISTNPSNSLCPITKKQIVEEYKAECGHVMEKSSAIELVRKFGHNRAKCPIIGCNRTLSNIR